MKKIEDRIIQTLMYRGKDDLASLLNNCQYELNESTTYGSRLYSVLTTVIIYVGIEKLNKVKHLDYLDKKQIVEAFQVVYPVKDNSYEISDVEFLQDPEAPIPGISEMRIPDEIEFEHWEKGFFRLFISHSSSNKNIAKEFKDELYNYGISAFVAHEDISPNKKWLNVIESSLVSSDGLLAILDSNFKESKWCDQEVGFSYGQNKIIVPINFGINPYGFISKFQALKSNSRQTYQIAYEVWKILISNELSSRKASYGFVKVFCESTSFEQAKRNSKLLEEIKYMDEKLIDEILNALKNNNQINKSFEVEDNVTKFIEAKRKLIHK